MEENDQTETHDGAEDQDEQQRYAERIAQIDGPSTTKALRIWCSTKHCKLRSWERLLLLLLITLEFLVEGAIDIHKDHNVRRNDSRNATTQSLKSDAQTRRC